jgi:predicted phage baseplate assembly protein
LTQESSPVVARARCLPPQGPDDPVKVLIVPRVEIPPEELVLDALVLPPSLVSTVSAHLDARRLLTTTVQIRPPAYQGVTVVTRLLATAGTAPEQVRDRALGALYRYVNPVVGGPDRSGWPFDRDLSLGEIFTLLTGVEGVAAVEEVRLFLADLADPRGGDRRDGGQTVRLRPDSLFASFQHQVLVR